MSFISADNTWVLWAVMVGTASLSIWLEQTYQWASKVTGCVLALVLMMILANFRVIPTDAPAYDNVWSYVVPLAVPLLLFNCDIRKIGRETGKLLVVYLLSSAGTVAGALLGAFALGKYVPELKAFSAMFTGTYTGGSVNFTAMADAFLTDKKLISAGVVADNLLMAIYFFVLIAIPGIVWFRNHYKHPLVDRMEAGAASANAAADYWKPKPVGLKHIAFNFAAATIIVAASKALAAYFGKTIPATSTALSIVNQLLGNQYLIMTTVTMILATSFPRVFSNAPGASETGTFLIYIFFGVIGAPASIMEIVANSPILFAYAGVVIVMNMVVTFFFGKLFRFNLEDLVVASNANVGGPTTAAAMAIYKGWFDLVGPALLVGTLGYVLGNYLGVIVANVVG